MKNNIEKKISSVYEIPWAGNIILLKESFNTEHKYLYDK